MTSSPSSDSPLAASPDHVVERLNFTTKLAYGAGDLGPAITANVLVFFLLYFFTNVAGLSAGLASSVLAIGKISDAINDPITGILSDRTRTRWGRRLPWMVGGAIPFSVLFFLQWLVPEFSPDPAVNQWGLFAYYVIVAILFNLAYTAVNLPYTALTPELTQDYNERTGLNSFRMAFSISGSILSLILAQILFGLYPGDPLMQYWALGLLCSLISVVAILWCALRIRERGADPIIPASIRQGLGYGLIGAGGLGVFLGVSWIVGGASRWGMIAAVLLGVLGVAFGITLVFSTPEAHLVGEVAQKARSLAAAAPNVPILTQLNVVLKTKPFLFVIGIYLCSWLAVQLTASILIYFVVSWMNLPEEAFPGVAIAVQGTALVMLFVWKQVSDRVGKKIVYALGTSIWIIAQGGLFFLQPGQVTALYLLASLAGCGVSVAYLIPWSMVPDIIEWDELNTGQRREGVFYGFMVLLQKFGLALALFLVGQGLDYAGFVERAPGEPLPVQPDSALTAIRLVVGPFPIVVLLLGLILVYFYPITRSVHDDIRRQLAERLAQQKLQAEENA
ncbi:MFS transporter [Spirulina major]|uniref:MFS transporter n=1 Tax=Spirulina major TaxID=270636 RepID=UPI00093224D0|nr:MFS transporter [Spirulina major]